MSLQNQSADTFKKQKEDYINNHIKRLKEMEKSSQLSQELSFSRGLKRILGE